MFGRWDETKGEDNIDFMPTILSRFDLIFVVKDEHNEARDTVLYLLCLLQCQSNLSYVDVIWYYTGFVYYNIRVIVVMSIMLVVMLVKLNRIKFMIWYYTNFICIVYIVNDFSGSNDFSKSKHNEAQDIILQ